MIWSIKTWLAKPLLTMIYHHQRAGSGRPLGLFGIGH
jgi:hypothetical protein